ncbi:MAG: rhodanese-like domain-containing protein [Pseudomonadota bacterium]
MRTLAAPLRWGRDAILLLGLSLVIAIPFDLLRDEGIDLVAATSYDDKILQPCPESEEIAPQMSALVLPLGPQLVIPEGTVLVDASAPETFAQGHLPGALSIPYDELDTLTDEDVQRLQGLKPRRVVVYCNGWEEETDLLARYPENTPGNQVANELKGRDFRDVRYIKGAVEIHLLLGGALEKGGAE